MEIESNKGQFLSEGLDHAFGGSSHVVILFFCYSYIIGLPLSQDDFSALTSGRCGSLYILVSKKPFISGCTLYRNFMKLCGHQFVNYPKKIWKAIVHCSLLSFYCQWG